ncbi:MAG TPA: phage tail protein, partial [Fervidobacterium sp.]|nr:phage tail protein [Fervidobacterium sp.]
MGKGGAGAVIGFVAGAASAFVGGGPVGTAVWITKGIQGAAIGYSLLSGPSTKYKSGETANTRSNVVPIPVIYGEHKVGGNIIYERVSHDQKELYVCVGLGEGEIESVSDIEVNGKPIIDFLMSEEYLPHQNVFYKVYTGDQFQTTADYRVLTGESFPNTAYIAFTFKINDQISSTPNITCVVKGRKIRVWKNGEWVTEFSNNPVWIVLDLLTNKRYGLGKDDGVIDLESFKAEAAYCDEIVDGEKRFELDYVLDTTQSSLDVLSNIMATFRANLLYSDGQLRIKIEKSELPVQAFNMDNIVAGSFSYSLDSINEMPNQIIGQFSDRFNDWELGSVVYDDEIDQEARGVFSQTLTLAGVTRPSQAGRLIRYYHDLTKLCDTFCEFQAGIDAIHCEAGDVITVSHDVPGWVNKEFLILEMQESEDDLITLRCRAYDSSIYHDKGSKYQPPEAPSLPNLFDLPPSVTNLQLSETHKQLPDGTWLPQIQVDWDIPMSVNWAKANIWLSTDGGNKWEYIKAVEGSSALIDVVSAGEHRIKVVSESLRRVQEVFATAPTDVITIVGKQLKPANVVWGDCNFSDTVNLTWLPVLGKDVAGYEVRLENANWGALNEALIYRGSELEYRLTPAQRNYTFYIKAFDRHGNYSEQASSITLSLPTPQVPQQPTVEAYFNVLKIKVNPLNLPSIQGYYVYITGDGIDDKIPVLAGGEIAYPLESGKTVTIQVSAYDILGEGAKSEPLQATTLVLQDRDIPDDIITSSKLAES